MVIAPCLTVKPHPDWSLVTEPSVYIHYEVLRFALFLNALLLKKGESTHKYNLGIEATSLELPAAS